MMTRFLLEVTVEMKMKQDKPHFMLSTCHVNKLLLTG